MGRVLIFADVHLRSPQMDTVLEWEAGYDLAVWMGDYWDNWIESIDQTFDTARWVKQKLGDPRHVLCVGNHDWAYVHCRNGYACCSGFTRQKSDAIRRILSQEDLDKLRPYWASPAHNLICTHAGISMDLINHLAARGYEYPEPANSLAAITSWLDRMWMTVQVKYSNMGTHPLMEAGADRGGLQRYGGITWAHWTGHSPIPGVGQLCGHSVQDNGPMMRLINRNGAPMWRVLAKQKVNPRWLKEGWSLCLDTNSRHYAVLEDDTLTIKAINWTRPTKGSDIGATVEPGGVTRVIHLKEPTAPVGVLPA